MSDRDSALALVRRAFSAANIDCRVSSREFPGELIIVVEVDAEDFESAINVSNDLDEKIDGGFITVKKVSSGERIRAPAERPITLADPRVSDLIELLNSRSRTSEQQPSLRYVADAAQTLAIATTRRHNLIFGRRGVGKTALMVEAKKSVERRGSQSLWLNVQTMRDLTAHEAFLTTAARLCDVPISVFSNRRRPPLSVERATELRKRIAEELALNTVSKKRVARLVPDLQQLVLLLCQETAEDFYIFMDELHYLKLAVQPVYLDLVHAITRDTHAWLKVAAIRHQARWFTDNPPTGLQTTHDAAIINLDVTLEQPAKAKAFLLSILRSFTDEVRLGSITNAISREAIDRLVLASGGVPRDFMILAAAALQVATRRANARTAGVQDVNEAAGKMAQTKLQELDDDAASTAGSAAARQRALKVIRNFLLDEKATTFLRVDFHDKEKHAGQYELLQSLVDLRMLHLINAGLSDEREGGKRSEVYMLDLSQFSGVRFRRNIRVLDFTRDHLVLKNTGDTAEPKVGDSPKRLQSILRRGPLFNLSALK